jgi:hypothetical protein
MAGLGQSTLSDDERRSEAVHLLNELINNVEGMQSHECRFVEEQFCKKDYTSFYISPKQLFWLRDLFQKYCV